MKRRLHLLLLFSLAFAAAGFTVVAVSPLVTHGAYIYLMDPRGRFANVIQGTETGEAIAAWLHEEMAHATE